MIIFPSLVVIFKYHFHSFTLFQYFIFCLTGLSAWVHQTFATIALQNENAGKLYDKLLTS